MSDSPIVAILMGSKSDLPSLQGAFRIFQQFGLPFTARVMSAHRTPKIAADFADSAEAKGIKIIICAAGMAAHLAGSIAAHTTLPIIGLPLASEPFNGLDALLSTVQMPPGIPVATVTAGKNGSKNAALYAIAILALSDGGVAADLKKFRREQADAVMIADKELQQELDN